MCNFMIELLRSVHLRRQIVFNIQIGTIKESLKIIQ